MTGIYGLCEYGMQLPIQEQEAISAAMSCGEAAASVDSASGSLLGVVGPSREASLYRGETVNVAIEADSQMVSALQRRSGRERTVQPAALLADLYEKHGVQCIEMLEGAFSVAIWDQEMGQLVLAVDRHALKPLYWCIEHGRLMFASHIRSLEAVMARAEVDPAAIVQYLVHSVIPAPLTILRRVERLEPGTHLLYRRGEVRKTRYWDLSYAESENTSVSAWSKQVRDSIRQAVHSHLADRGLNLNHTGAYLSGGTDSSSVVAFATEQQSPFNSFSIYFDNPRYDEVAFARLAAKHFGTRHHEKCLHPADALDATWKIVEHYEEPFANSSAIGAYHCAKLAREMGVDTLLAGDGGDELFAGNERYASDRKFDAYQAVPQLVRSGLKQASVALPKSGPLSIVGRYIRRSELPNPQRMFSYNFFLSAEGRDALSPDFASAAYPEAALDLARAHFDSAPHASSELNRLLYMDVKMTLSDNDLRKVLGTAEIAGVQVRFPLLDRQLVELSGRIPSRLKLKGLEKRYIFKQAMKDILPSAILHKKKHGFGVPVGYWLISDPELKSLSDVLDEPRTTQRGYFHKDFIPQLKKLTCMHPAYFGEVLWSILMLELWHRQREQQIRHSSSELPRVGAVRAS